MRSVIAFLLPVALVACATGAQRQATAIGTELKQMKIEMQACVDAVWSNPAYAPLTAHAPKDIRDATILQLSDDSHLQASERPLFSQLYSDITQCRKTQAENAAQAVPTIVQYLVEQQTLLDNAALNLFQQKISWGEFNQRRKLAYETTMPKINAAFLDLRHELEDENNAELAQRQAAAQAFMQYYQNQQLINAVSRPQVITTAPTTTNCNTFGNSTNCYTH